MCVDYPHFFLFLFLIFLRLTRGTHLHLHSITHKYTLNNTCTTKKLQKNVLCINISSVSYESGVIIDIWTYPHHKDTKRNMHPSPPVPHLSPFTFSLECIFKEYVI